MYLPSTTKHLRNVHQWANCMCKYSSSVCAWCIRLKNHFYTAQQKIRTQERCVYIYSIFSHTRASSIKTKNERNTKYIEDNSKLSPSQTETQLKTNATSYTKGTMNATVRETIHFWTRKRIALAKF